MRKKFLLLSIAALICCNVAKAQMYLGMTGLIHVPSAEMNEAGDARIGVHYIPNEMLSSRLWEYYGKGKLFDSYSYYFSITPFRWMEATYECTAVKTQLGNGSYNVKDRLLYEGKYWPLVVMGAQDVFGSTVYNSDITKGQAFFGNWYVAATKHFMVGGNEIAGTLAYRYYLKEWNKKH